MSLFPNLTISGLRIKHYSVPYPTELKCVGDHIRKIRLDRGLKLEDLAKIVGVSTGTVSHWEYQKRMPQIYTFPAIIKFLGYDPLFIDSDTILAKIENYRRTHGLTYKKLARLASIGNEVIREIVKGNHEKYPQALQKVLNIIDKETSD